MGDSPGAGLEVLCNPWTGPQLGWQFPLQPMGYHRGQIFMGSPQRSRGGAAAHEGHRWSSSLRGCIS